MPGTFSPPPTSKETACYRSRHASRHVRDARAVMHVGIANPRWPGKTFPAFPAHAQPTILRIWQEAHCLMWHSNPKTHYFACIIHYRNNISRLYGGPPITKEQIPEQRFHVTTPSCTMASNKKYYARHSIPYTCMGFVKTWHFGSSEFTFRLFKTLSHANANTSSSHFTCLSMYLNPDRGRRRWKGSKVNRVS